MLLAAPLITTHEQELLLAFVRILLLHAVPAK